MLGWPSRKGILVALEGREVGHLTTLRQCQNEVQSSPGPDSVIFHGLTEKSSDVLRRNFTMTKAPGLTHFWFPYCWAVVALRGSVVPSVRGIHPYMDVRVPFVLVAQGEKPGNGVALFSSDPCVAAVLEGATAKGKQQEFHHNTIESGATSVDQEQISTGDSFWSFLSLPTTILQGLKLVVRFSLSVRTWGMWNQINGARC